LPFFKRNTQRGPRIKILFCSDLHGSEYTFSKLLRALELWEPTVYVGGGDVTGKAMVPIVNEGRGRHRLQWMGREIEVRSEDELDAMEVKVKQLGFYPYRAPASEIQALRDDPHRSQLTFERLMSDRWAAWLDKLEARCAELRVPAFVIPGNDDPWCIDEVTLRDREWVTAADGRVLSLLDEWRLLSCGIGNTTPWSCPRDTTEVELGRKLAELAEDVDSFTSVVGNIHVPPHGSTLDIAPLLDTTTSPPRPVAGETAPAGSTAVRSFIETHQPLLSLHGHVHESPGAINIGRTKALNPGSEYAEGVLRAVLVTLERDRVVGHQFVTG
jgi:Icc-related predicted phosphoesterase